MLVVGDVHGKFGKLNQALIGVDDLVIQVGDLGIGFADVEYPKKFFPDFRFIRGNHDNQKACRQHPNYLFDYGLYHGIYLIGGADSIDKQWRVEGRDWWPEEELNYQELSRAVSECLLAKPKVIITHDCPQSIAETFLGIESKSITRQALQSIFDNFSPDYWIFGHHHKHLLESAYGTTFIGLEELETFNLNWTYYGL